MGVTLTPPEPPTIVQTPTEAAIFLVLTADPGSEAVIRHV